MGTQQRQRQGQLQLYHSSRTSTWVLINNLPFTYYWLSHLSLNTSRNALCIMSQHSSEEKDRKASIYLSFILKRPSWYIFLNITSFHLSTCLNTSTDMLLWEKSYLREGYVFLSIIHYLRPLRMYSLHYYQQDLRDPGISWPSLSTPQVTLMMIVVIIIVNLRPKELMHLNIFLIPTIKLLYIISWGIGESHCCFSFMP